MSQPFLKKFLVEFGRYFEPAAVFYHARIAEGLTQLGFQVRLIERLSSASSWDLRLKATLEAQAQLIGQTFRSRNLSYGQATKRLEGWLKMQLRSILRDLDSGVKVGQEPRWPLPAWETDRCLEEDQGDRLQPASATAFLLSMPLDDRNPEPGQPRHGRTGQRRDATPNRSP